MKEEKSRSDAAREGELTTFIKENEQLKYSNEELKKEYDSKSEELNVKTRVSGCTRVSGRTRGSRCTQSKWVC